MVALPTAPSASHSLIWDIVDNEIGFPTTGFTYQIDSVTAALSTVSGGGQIDFELLIDNMVIANGANLISQIDQ